MERLYRGEESAGKQTTLWRPASGTLEGLCTANWRMAAMAVDGFKKAGKRRRSSELSAGFGVWSAA